MRVLLRSVALGVGGLAFVVGAKIAIGGRTGKVEESVPLAVVDQTDKLAAAGVMLAGAVLFAGAVIASQFPDPPDRP